MVQFDSLDGLHKLVGQEIAVSDWVEITQERINKFAEATDDHQWIHVDVERARQSPFGGTIAHGYLTMSLIAGFSQRTMKFPARMGVNYGSNKIRFISPVPAGSRLRGRFTLKQVENIEGGLQMTMSVTVEREGSDKPACVAETMSRVYA